jgi:hypothetical protein
MTGILYDTLKYTALIGLPALIAFYGVVAATWGFQYTEQILTTAAAFNALLGALLGISSTQYYKSKV